MAAMAKPPVSYVGSTKWSAVAAWAATTAYSVGNMVRQNATPTVGNERVFVCIIAGTSLASEPSWVLTFGAKTAEAGGPTWMEVTGQPGVNNDLTNVQTWTTDAKSNTVALGQIIYDSNTTSIQICTTAGTAGSGAAPSFSGTAGTTTADNTVTWTSLGATSSFANWAGPHARIGNASSAWINNNATSPAVFISKNSAETSAALTNISLVGSAAKLVSYLSVDDTVALPPTSSNLVAGASVSTTGTNSINIFGFSYLYGITFNVGSGTGNPVLTLGTNNNSSLFFDTCTFKIVATGASASIQLGTASLMGVYLNIIGCTFLFSATGQQVTLGSITADVINAIFASSGSIPSTLLAAVSTTNYGIMNVRDSDLSAVTGTLVSVGNFESTYLIIENGKLGAGVAMTSGSFSRLGIGGFRLHNCDSGSKNYRFYESNYLSTIQQETTTVHTGGATDGTTAISWNIGTSANASFTQPYQAMEITQWNDTTGAAKTATVEIAGANQLTNGDIWMEIEYLGSSTVPQGSVANNRKSNVLASNTNVTSSAASWGGSPAFTQKLQVSFTPQMKGPVKARIFVAKPSITVYVDPLITIA